MNDTTIAHYRIAEKIGQGGMGEVYRATDTKLNRQVALKVLPEAFAGNPERMARFSREAQVLASLNHPNIAAIHGLEESGGRRALVMELVEGETLAGRLARGPLPVDEALGIARQIAEALEEAHERGIIHRDLKPANVKITPAGTVKLLDFGLAKALEGDAAVSAAVDLTQSPTLSAMATQAGVIMGTASYMSPEQARGQKVDRRSDVWSFGVVLYEMLTGRMAFIGDTASDVLASVLKTDLDLAKLPTDVPPAVRQLLKRCLVRDPKQRLQSIGDARIVIAEHLSGAEPPASAPVASVAPVTPRWRRVLPWALAGLAVVALAVFATTSRRATAEPPLRLSIEVANERLRTSIGANVVLSPDGTQLAFIVGDDSKGELRVRPLERFDGVGLVTSAGQGNVPYHPFFSPDGKWVGYVTASELLKVPVSGGTPQTLCRVERSRGASWGEDGTIIFARSPNSGLFRVSDSGGEPQPVTTLDAAKGEATHRWPQVLPGGKAVLFTTHTQATGKFDSANLEVVVLATGERKTIHRGGAYGRYVPSGHVVYASNGSLFAMPFDLDALEPAGSPAPVAQDVAWDVSEGGSQFTVSDTGRLSYVRGENTVPEYPIIWVERNGGIASAWTEPGSYANPRLSPDGKRLALTQLRDGNWDIWVLDLERGVPTRLTFDDSVESEQVWTPDGEYLIFSSDQAGVDNLYRKRADGSGQVERLSEMSQAHWAHSVAPDGRFVAFIGGDVQNDIWVMPLDGARKPEPFVSSRFGEGSASFSPDGRWLAYDSNESGRQEVYVRPFPARGGKWQVSDGGGAYPKWSRDGKELYYRVDEGLMVAAVETVGETFRAGKPRPLFSGAFRGGTSGLALGGYVFSDYDVAPDGNRFIMFAGAGPSGRTEHPHITLLTQWFDELRRTFAKAGR